MVHSSVVSILERGRGTRNLAHRVSEIVRNEPDLFPELMFGLWHVEGPIRCLAANAVEMVTREHPKMLQPFKTEILGLMTEARPAPVRCQLALLIPRMKLNKGERERATELLRGYLEDRSASVRGLAKKSLTQLKRS